MSDNANELGRTSEFYLDIRNEEFRFIAYLLQGLENNGVLDARRCYIAGSIVMNLFGLTPDRSMYDPSYVSDIDLVVPKDVDLDLIAKKLHELNTTQSLNLSIVHNGTSIKVTSSANNIICMEILSGLKVNEDYHPFFDSILLNPFNLLTINEGLCCWNLFMCLVYKLEYWREKDIPDVQCIIELYSENENFINELMEYLRINNLENAQRNLAELRNT